MTIQAAPEEYVRAIPMACGSSGLWGAAASADVVQQRIRPGEDGASCGALPGTDMPGINAGHGQRLISPISRALSRLGVRLHCHGFPAESQRGLIEGREQSGEPLPELGDFAGV